MPGQGGFQTNPTLRQQPALQGVCKGRAWSQGKVFSALCLHSFLPLRAGPVSLRWFLSLVLLPMALLFGQ